MRPAIWIALGALGALVGLATGCSKGDEPQGPFVPLVARLPAETGAVLLVEVAGWRGSFDGLERELSALPLVARNPAAKRAVEEQAGLLRGLVAMAQARLGFDPLRDLERAAVGLVLVPDADPDVVVVAQGRFPADLFARLLPGVEPTQQQGQAVYRVPEAGSEVCLIGGTLLVAATSGRLGAALGARPDQIDPKLRAAHPGLLRPSGPELNLRLSVQVPTWASSQMALVPGAAPLAGVRQVFFEIGPQVELAAGCSDARACDHVQSLLEAQAELLAGGLHFIRGLGYFFLALDIEGLSDLPPALLPILADREGLLGTLEQLFPEPAGPPAVERGELEVRLRMDRATIRGVGLLCAAGLAAAVPVAIEARAQVQTEAAELDAALKAAEDAAQPE